MAEKTNNSINQNIQSTYHIDQQIEKKEESERKEAKVFGNICNPFMSPDDFYKGIVNPFNKSEDFYEEKEIFNDNDPILDNFDDKILNEMTLIYNNNEVYDKKIRIFGINL